MPAYKNKENGSWYVVTQYTDWTGERKPKCKRGFATRREALEWEQKFQQQSAGDLDMSFEAFCEIYTNDLKARLKESTWQTKENIIKTKLLPYFGKRKINEITTKDVIAWQNELLSYRDEKRKPYSQTYLKTLHNQLSAIFNHAVRFYDLHSNPAAKAGNMGTEERREMLFWTKEEYQRLQERMSRMFGVEGTDNLHFAVYAKQLGAGLDEQLERFIREHPDTRLIVIDTLQKIREVSTDAYSYANDYDIVGRMKQFADKNGVCLLLVHHTRKQQAGDKFEMISGTTGLLGCADGAFLLQKEKRTDLNTTLEIVGRDQPDQKLHLTRDAEKLTWQLDHAETELWKKPPDPLLSKLAAVIAGDTPVWNGSATELVALLGEDMQPNILTRRLNVKAGELLNEHGIEYTVKRTRSGSFISLARKAV